MTKILIGVAWPYANGAVHPGHIAGSILPADIFSKFQKMCGNEVMMVSGSDEHGTPIMITAETEKKKPQEIADLYHLINKKVFDDLGVEFENYSRTSSEQHKSVVKQFFITLYEQDYIYKATMVSPYCPNCNRFLPDRYIEGTCPYCRYDKARGDQCDNCGKTLDAQELISPRCRICGAVPEFKESEHLFFKLSKFESKIRDWIKPKTYWRDNVKNFTEKYLEMGLKDRAITRDLEWGVDVPLPGFEEKRIYVWFDAVIGYLSSSMSYSKKILKPDYWKEYWHNVGSRHYYFLGKDNIPFHTIIWPAMLMAHRGLELPYDVPANEYLRVNSERFSKSRGVGITMPELLQRYDPDMIRFYLALNLPEQRDSEFSLTDLITTVNQELIDKYGNFVNRALIFTKTRFGKVPEAGTLDDEDLKMLKDIEATNHAMKEYLNNVEEKKAFKEWLTLMRSANVYFDYSAPWDLYKQNIEKCKTKLHVSLRLLRALAIMAYPYIPFSSQKIWNMLGYSDSIAIRPWSDALNDIESNELPEPAILFKKIVEQESYKDWNKMDIRVAKIENVEDHPNADRLYKLTVNFGTEKKVLIAGLKKYYTKEEMLNKKVLMLYNLEPSTIRGVVSQGMILAGEDEEEVSMLVVENEEPGKKVFANGVESFASEVLKHSVFEELRFEIATVKKVDAKITVEGKQEYLIDYPAPKTWENRLCVLFFENNSPMILHVNENLVTLDRALKPGGKVR